MAAELNPTAGFIRTAYVLGFFFRRFFLAGTLTHSSSSGEASGLFISGLMAAMSCELTISSLGRFHKSEVLLTKICWIVWQPSSLTLLTLWALASVTFLPRARPSWFPNDLAQPSVCSVSWRSCFNSCNTWAIPFLIVRNNLFLFYKIHPSSRPFLNNRNAVHCNLKRPV